MHTASSSPTPRQSELANSLTHGLGVLGAIAATPILVVWAVHRGGAADVVGSSVFAASMLMLYTTSTLYHALPVGPGKERLQRWDHAAIYVLIAGTYTPFTLGVLGGPWGWTLFGIVWGAAAIGILTKLVAGVCYPRISTAMYLVMGWLILIAIDPLVGSMAPRGIGWLVAGGAFYTAGVPFFVSRRMPYGHVAWHLFVLAGSVCHFFAVLWYASSPPR
jgi:hemolysin III